MNKNKCLIAAAVLMVCSAMIIYTKLDPVSAGEFYSVYQECGFSEALSIDCKSTNGGESLSYMYPLKEDLRILET